jgi:hypothetical protein
MKKLILLTLFLFSTHIFSAPTLIEDKMIKGISKYATNTKVYNSISSTNQANKVWTTNRINLGNTNDRLVLRTFATNKVNSGLTNLHGAVTIQISTTNFNTRVWTTNKINLGNTNDRFVLRTFTTNRINAGLTNLHSAVMTQISVTNFNTRVLTTNRINLGNTNDRLVLRTFTTNKVNEGNTNDRLVLRTFTTNKVNVGLTNLHKAIVSQISTTNFNTRVWTTNKVNVGLTNLHIGAVFQTTNSLISSNFMKRKGMSTTNWVKQNQQQEEATYKTNLLAIGSLYRTNNDGIAFTAPAYPSMTSWTNVGNHYVVNTNVKFARNPSSSLVIGGEGGGYYFISFSLSSTPGANNRDIYAGISINGDVWYPSVARTRGSATGVFYNVVGNCVIKLSAGDIIRVVVGTSASGNIIIAMGNLTIQRIR